MKVTCAWQQKPFAPVGLKKDVVHLWKVTFDKNEADILHYRTLLAADELKKADAYRFEKDRTAYTITRGILRTLLGEYLGKKPEDIIFSYGKFGKPEIVDESIDFNVSHSGKAALFCFTPGIQCGIDLEEVRPMHDLDGMAKYIMSETEYETFKKYPPSRLVDLFFNYWTGKESYIKAIGKGLSHHPEKANFTIGSDEALRLDMPDKDCWFFRSFIPQKGYHASVCVYGNCSEIQWYLA